MALSLHTIAPARGARKKSFRIGRGNASGLGKTAGRGTKGQKARTGGRNKLKKLGIRQMLLSFPKNRGFKSRYLKSATVRIDAVVKAYRAHARVDLKSLKKLGLIHSTSTTAKLVGNTKIEIPLTFVDIAATQAAKQAVEAAGGKFERTQA